jgi:hypothetical protein
MQQALEALITWQADPAANGAARYVRGMIHPGMGLRPMHMIQLLELGRDAEGLVLVARRSVTVSDDAPLAAAVIREALQRWKAGDFDKVPAALDDVLLRAARRSEVGNDTGPQPKVQMP